MPYMLVRISLGNFSQWKSVWDDPEQVQIRDAYGCKGMWVFRGIDSPEETVILMEWDDIDDAKEFGISDELRGAMNKSGSVGRPDVLFVEDVP